MKERPDDFKYPIKKLSKDKRKSIAGFRENSTECEECGKVYSSRSSLWKHKKILHCLDKKV